MKSKELMGAILIKRSSFHARYFFDFRSSQSPSVLRSTTDSPNLVEIIRPEYKKKKSKEENTGSHFYRSGIIEKGLVAGVLASSINLLVTDAESEPESRKKIIAIVKKGNLEELKEYLNRENYSEIRDEDGHTPLLIAATEGHLEIVRWLLKENIASIRETNKKGSSAFLLACVYGHKDLAIWLLKEGGASLKEKDHDNQSALIKAINSGNDELVEYLVSLGVSVNDKTARNNESPLLFAAARGNIKVFELLLSIGADINEKTLGRDSPLTVAARYGHAEMVKYLIDKCGLKVSERNSEGESAFLVAAANGHLNVVKILLERGSAVNEKNNENATALLLAAYGENKKNGGVYEELIRFLIDNGANVKDKDKSGCTPLLHAALEDNNALVQFFIKEGLDVNEGDKDGFTALHYAVLNSNVGLVTLLLNSGASIDLRDRHGHTAFDITEKNLYEFYRSEKKEAKDAVVSTAEDFVKNSSSATDIRQIASQRREEEFIKAINDWRVFTLKKEEDKEKDIRSVVETFRKNLSERLNVILYTDKAIWEETVKTLPGNIEKLLEIGQLISTTSGDMPVRIAANLAKIYVENNLEEYRKNKTSYIRIFKNKSISEITREAAKMIGERYREQLWELSAEGIDDFSQYFCEKLIEELRRRYKKDSVSATTKTIPIVREMFDIMVKIDLGPSIPLELRGKDKKEINRDKEESWDSRELINNVGIVVERKYLESEICVIYPLNGGEFKKQLTNWQGSSKRGNVLFIYSPDEHTWRALLVKDNEKKLEEKLVASDSVFMEELKKVTSETVSSYKIDNLQTLLRKNKLFANDKPDTLYVLKPGDKKYGVCYGDKYDVLNPKFNYCAFLGIFSCRPQRTSEVEKHYDNSNVQKSSKQSILKT